MGYVKAHCRPKSGKYSDVKNGHCSMGRGKKGAAKNIKKKTGRALVKAHRNPKVEHKIKGASHFTNSSGTNTHTRFKY